jgi:hypothetical protein
VPYNQRTRDLPDWQRQCGLLFDRYSHTKEQVVGLEALATSYNQTQAVVQWAPSVQPGWQVELQQKAGYKVRQLRQATPADELALEDRFHRLCEYCTQSADPKGEEPAKRCGACARMYHVQLAARHDA